MLYYLFEYLEKQYQFPGASLFGFITFRAAIAIILSLLFSTIFGKRIIRFLQKQQVGETIRDLGLEGQAEKEGTPTMGGIIIILATLIPVLLLAKLGNQKNGNTMYCLEAVSISSQKIKDGLFTKVNYNFMMEQRPTSLLINGSSMQWHPLN